MKKIALLVVLLALVAFLVPTYAVKPSNGGEKEIVSGYAETVYPGEQTKVLLTVSAGKTFVLTDIVGNSCIDCSSVHIFEIRENDIVEVRLRFEWNTTYVSDENPQMIHFNSGIPFSAGTDVVLSSYGSSDGEILISGYEI